MARGPAQTATPPAATTGRVRALVEDTGYRGLVLDRLVRQSALVVAAPQACLLVYRRGGGDAAIVAAGFGIDEEMIGQALPAPYEGADAPFADGGPFSGDPGAPGRAVWAPVFGEDGGLAGRLEVVEAAEQTGTERNRSLLARQAEQVGAALDHLRLPRRVAGAILDETERLAAAMDAYGGYSLPKGAEADLVREVAQQLELSVPAAIEAELGACLYDLGRVGAEDNEASDASATAATLVHVPGLEPVATVVRHHCERWDGTGEPDALGGLRIPISSRVVGACRAFRDLASADPAMSALAAVDELEAAAGSRFDPNVVAALAAGVRSG